MLIPLGSWCRTAFQVKQFEKNRGQTIVSYPFDWTITPFQSLKDILNNSFNPNFLFKDNVVDVSKFGSAQDPYSHLIFHHDLSPEIMHKFFKSDSSFGLARSSGKIPVTH